VGLKGARQEEEAEMAVNDVKMSSLDLVSQRYRVPGVLPGPIEPSATLGVAEASPFKVADQAIR
jgi:hypothetical protein